MAPRMRILRVQHTKAANSAQYDYFGATVQAGPEISHMHRWGDSGSADFGDVHFYNYNDGAQTCILLL